MEIKFKYLQNDSPVDRLDRPPVYSQEAEKLLIRLQKSIQEVKKLESNHKRWWDWLQLPVQLAIYACTSRYSAVNKLNNVSLKIGMIAVVKAVHLVSKTIYLQKNYSDQREIKTELHRKLVETFDHFHCADEITLSNRIARFRAGIALQKKVYRQPLLRALSCALGHPPITLFDRDQVEKLVAPPLFSKRGQELWTAVNTSLRATQLFIGIAMIGVAVSFQNWRAGGRWARLTVSVAALSFLMSEAIHRFQIKPKTEELRKELVSCWKTLVANCPNQFEKMRSAWLNHDLPKLDEQEWLGYPIPEHIEDCLRWSELSHPPVLTRSVPLSLRQKSPPLPGGAAIGMIVSGCFFRIGLTQIFVGWSIQMVWDYRLKHYFQKNEQRTKPPLKKLADIYRQKIKEAAADDPILRVNLIGRIRNGLRPYLSRGEIEKVITFTTSAC